MPYATNPRDGRRIYFEDDGGDGAAVVFHGGLLDSVELVRDSHIARALPRDEFRLVYADHRGVGRSDKPQDPEAYAMPLRVADAVAVLEERGIERAHFIGASYGGRLGYGIGEHASERALSLVIGGHQPYAVSPDGPLARVIPGALAASRREGSLEPFVQALETVAGARFPPEVRARYLDNDPAAIEAASSTMLAEGPISSDLGAWQVRCLIHIGVGDADFYEQAQRAANEIPNAEFIAIEDADHVGAHLRPGQVIPAVLRTLRAAS
jgi:pimeloyl-ACP methyl ester carboxylesterase